MKMQFIHTCIVIPAEFRANVFRSHPLTCFFRPGFPQYQKFCDATCVYSSYQLKLLATASYKFCI